VFIFKAAAVADPRSRQRHNSTGEDAMNTQVRWVSWILAALLLAVAVAWVSADNDDRPPIIVTNGSMYFTNGDPSSPIQPTMWVQDVTLGEWKPVDAGYHGIRGFEVSFENSYASTVCPDASSIPPAKPTTPLASDEVRIEYTTGGGKTISTKVHRRRADLWGLLGKNEPKVNKPNGAGNQDFTVVGSTQLEFDDPPVGTTHGYVSKVSVGKTDCAFPAPSSDAERLAFRVRIQPKIDE
jgi:hypothetical protein